MWDYLSSVARESLDSLPAVFSATWVSLSLAIIPPLVISFIKYLLHRKKEVGTWKQVLTSLPAGWRDEVKNAVIITSVWMLVVFGVFAWNFLDIASKRNDQQQAKIQELQNASSSFNTLKMEHDAAQTQVTLLQNTIKSIQGQLAHKETLLRERDAIQLSHLDRLRMANERMSQKDKEKFSNALHAFLQFLDDGNSLYGEILREGTKINKAWRKGSIADEDILLERKEALQNLVAPAKQLAQTFPKLRNEWRYFSEQTNFIFGDNPDNEGPNALINAVQEYFYWIDHRWAKIGNKNERDIMNMFQEPHNLFKDRLRGFALWKQGSEQRLEQMRISIQ